MNKKSSGSLSALVLNEGNMKNAAIAKEKGAILSNVFLYIFQCGFQ